MKGSGGGQSVGKHEAASNTIRPGFRSWDEQGRREGAKQNGFWKKARTTLRVKQPCWWFRAQTPPAKLRVFVSSLFNRCFQVHTSSSS
jgi:hypothetical protein